MPSRRPTVRYRRSIRRPSLLAGWGCFAGAVGCASATTPDLPTGLSTGAAFEGMQCSSVRAPTEPDLMAWDSASRANMSVLANQGVVAVRYRAEGCNVELEVLSNCIGRGNYGYTPYAATDTKIARTARELFSELPIGAARLGGKLKGGRALRTDYTLVGVRTLPVGKAFAAADLAGPDCARATHVVSKVYVGGFAMVAGDTHAIEASGRIFGVGGGVSEGRAAEHLAKEGNADACDKAQSSGEKNALCEVPLRVGLLPIEGRADGGCPTGSVWDGRACVDGTRREQPVDGQAPTRPTERKVVTQVPAGSSRCVPGLHRDARGRVLTECPPDAAAVPSATAPAGAPSAPALAPTDSPFLPGPPPPNPKRFDTSPAFGGLSRLERTGELRACGYRGGFRILVEWKLDRTGRMGDGSATVKLDSSFFHGTDAQARCLVDLCTKVVQLPPFELEEGRYSAHMAVGMSVH